MWYTKARKVMKDEGRVIHYPATGFLEERLWNVRKRSKRGSTQQMPEACQSQSGYIPGDTDFQKSFIYIVKDRKCMVL